MRTLRMICVLLGSWAATLPATAQDAGPPGPLTSPIDVEKIDVSKSKKADEGWVLTISCSKAKEIKLPEGAILDFELRHGITGVHFFSYKMGSKSRFKIAEKTGLVGIAKNIMVRMKLVYEKQPTNVRKYIDGKTEKFPTARKPWQYAYPQNRFDFGDEKGLEAQKAEVKGFFKEKIEALVAADRKLSDARKKAIAGEGFQKAGKFDPNGWQKWVEEEVRDSIRTVQKDIRDAPTLKFLMARRDLDKYLMDLSRIIAKRSYERSRSVYEQLGLSPDPSDSAPKNIDANARKTRARDIRLLIDRLSESQGIEGLNI
ncbi:MAG: hypothetical protein AAF517_25290 [Planctomycetota bacterium]